MSAPRKTFRLTDALIARVEAIAQAHGMDFSTAARIALQRGLAVWEQDQAGPAPSPPRRRVFSRGIGP